MSAKRKETGPEETEAPASDAKAARSEQAPEAKAPKAASRKRTVETPSPSAASAPPQAETAGGFPIVGIGASAGGLEAFEAFFKAMPSGSGMAFVLVAHLDPTHVSILADLLQKRTAMPVLQVEDGVQIAPNTVYVIPPNRELAILNGALLLQELSRPRGANLPIDTFFRSLAQDQGANAVCIILSGTGTDGTLGLKAVKGELGMVMVQDKASAKYDGMPKSAIATGLADYVLPPEKMPEQLIEYVKYASRRPAPVVISEKGKMPEALQKIFVRLRAHTNHDFSLYKKNTICRRIERRMHVHQISNISDYVRFLQEGEHEVEILFKELLIGVTNFFRDPQAFDALKEKVLPELLAEKPDGYTFRAWIPGCSSGEEAYSIAIILQECIEDSHRHINVQLFGTDIDTDAVDTARAGLYPASISADVSPERLKRFFEQQDATCRIARPVREMLVFAPQNVIKDPPFTKLDLICCRNLLIYMEPELQQKLLPVFHYSLRPQGILFLGSSESVGPAVDLYDTVDRKWKIFRRKPSLPQTHQVMDFPTALPAAGKAVKQPEAPAERVESVGVGQLVEAILAQSDIPPCVMIDASCNIVYIHGRTGRYLEPAQGMPNINLLEMARPGLRTELTAAVKQVCSTRRQATRKGLRVGANGGRLLVDVTVRPVLEHAATRGFMLVMFEETASKPAKAKGGPAPAQANRTGRDAGEIEQELQHTRENLQTTIEELETANEELKSTNEELQSTNEELQSTNEELETSKEELQSLNEESVTVNVELQGRIEELSKANDDMKNLLDSTQIAVLFLDTDLCVRRFTTKATEIVPLTATDSGRPIRHFAANLIGVDLDEYARAVLEDLSIREAEVEGADGHRFVMRVRPYRTTNNVIDGVVITFDDITERRRLQEEKEEARSYASAIVDAVREPLLALDGDLKVVSANRSFYRDFRVTPEQTVGRLIYDLGNRQWDIPELRELLEKILPENSSFDDFEVAHEFPNLGKRRMRLNARRVDRGSGKPPVILLAIANGSGKQ